MQASADKSARRGTRATSHDVERGSVQPLVEPLRVCSERMAPSPSVANDFCEVWLKENYLDLLQDDTVAAASGQQLQLTSKWPGQRQRSAGIVVGFGDHEEESRRARAGSGGRATWRLRKVNPKTRSTPSWLAAITILPRSGAGDGADAPGKGRITRCSCGGRLGQDPLIAYHRAARDAAEGARVVYLSSEVYQRVY